MRAIIVAMFLVGAFVAGLLIAEANPAAADGPPKKAQWQYQCFEADGVAQVTERGRADLAQVGTGEPITVVATLRSPARFSATPR